MSSFESASVYPDALRRVSYFDAETGKRLKFPTNNFTLPALTIAKIYKRAGDAGFPGYVALDPVWTDGYTHKLSATDTRR